MPKKAAKPKVSKEERAVLEGLSSPKAADRWMSQRAKIVLLSAEGQSDAEISRTLRVDANTVATWRKRFIAGGSACLADLPRSGRPPTYDERTREAVLALLKTPPPEGMTAWDGKRIAFKLKISACAVWRILRGEGIRLNRRRRS
ncbi:MAG: helix-turn-helix domain-containing protein [Deltaproteobacteria bacterium]|jgi:transposase|nr:helix-turn-helix domain-containing protein [Deltaproteobacteria bacterium]